MGNSHTYAPRDQAGKVAIVTGANTGVGFETAAELAKLHAHVIVTCRNVEKGTETVKQIKELHPDANIEYMVMEMSNLESVRKFVRDFKSKNLPLNILVNNAGIMNTPYVRTEDGFEQQFAVNHIAHFLLTISLLDKIKQSAPSKIVNLSSTAHQMGQASYFDKVGKDQPNYDGWLAYGSSKMANVLFSLKLARELQGTGVTANAVHPGVVRTDINRHSKREAQSTKEWILAAIPGLWFKMGGGKTPYQGALTTMTVVADPVADNISGKYWADCKVTSSSSASTSVENQEKLWNMSLKWTGLEDPFVSATRVSEFKE